LLIIAKSEEDSNRNQFAKVMEERFLLLKDSHILFVDGEHHVHLDR
jgi:hypothetical protein